MSDSEDSIGDLLCTQAPSIDERWVAQKPSKEKVTIKREKQKTDSDSISSDEESSESKKEKKPNIDFSDSESESEGWLRRTKGVSHSGYSHQWTVKDDLVLYDITQEHPTWEYNGHTYVPTGSRYWEHFLERIQQQISPKLTVESVRNRWKRFLKNSQRQRIVMEAYANTTAAKIGSHNKATKKSRKPSLPVLHVLIEEPPNTVESDMLDDLADAARSDDEQEKSTSEEEIPTKPTRLKKRQLRSSSSSSTSTTTSSSSESSEKTDKSSESSSEDEVPSPPAKRRKLNKQEEFVDNVIHALLPLANNDLDVCVRALFMCSGNIKQAEKLLRAQGDVSTFSIDERPWQHYEDKAIMSNTESALKRIMETRSKKSIEERRRWLQSVKHLFG